MTNKANLEKIIAEGAIQVDSISRTMNPKLKELLTNAMDALNELQLYSAKENTARNEDTNPDNYCAFFVTFMYRTDEGSVVTTKRAMSNHDYLTMILGMKNDL